MQVKAQRTKLHEIRQESARLSLTVKRELGFLLEKHGRKKGRPTDVNAADLKLNELGLDRFEAARYQQIARLPTYAFDRILRMNVPSVNKALQELQRVNALDVILKEHKRDRKELKKYVMDGYTPGQCRQELESAVNPVVDIDVDDDDTDDVFEAESDFHDVMQNFLENGQAMADIVDEIEEAFSIEKVISKDDYQIAINATRLMWKAVQQLKQIIKENKEKLSD